MKCWIEGFAFDGEESFKIAECDTEKLAILIAQCLDRGEFRAKFINNEYNKYRIRVVNFETGDIIWEGRE